MSYSLLWAWLADLLTLYASMRLIQPLPEDHVFFGMTTETVVRGFLIG